MMGEANLKAAHRKLTARVMGKPGVTGTAIGERGGKPCLKVYVAEKGAAKTLPRTVDGIRVVIEVTGPVRPL